MGTHTAIRDDLFKLLKAIENPLSGGNGLLEIGVDGSNEGKSALRIDSVVDHSQREESYGPVQSKFGREGEYDIPAEDLTQEGTKVGGCRAVRTSDSMCSYTW